jgi:hypothetical protein
MAREFLGAGGAAFDYGDKVLDLSDPLSFKVVSVLRYARANKGDDEMLSSRQYGRGGDRVNHWVVVRFEERKKVYATWAYVKEGAQLTGKPALQLPTIGKERALWPKGVFDLGVLAYVWCG